jgi:hypothetical protein
MNIAEISTHEVDHVHRQTYAVMNNTDFTIGMLVAFQIFSSRLSQPMLRLV